MHARIDCSSPRSGAAARSYAETRQPTVRTFLYRALAVLALWQDRWRQRRLLETLDNRAMHDLALSRADIHREASKPFWLG